MKARIPAEKDHMAASVRAAEILAEKLRDNPESNVTFAAGNTPLDCYRLLIEWQREGRVDLRRACYIGLDEWIGLGPEDEGSCIQTMNSVCCHPAGIPRERIFCFDGCCPDPQKEARRMSVLIS